ncbi:hypothetical protein [Xanthomonas translucens]|uniref:hypothetical protein n=1 Tax=Xanthomonas campestris pv. translucens TaxID=343 RepID=UPI00071E872A|nr:hypothetical protein [Xanthomonas translucens]WLA08668.1 hypothetical protein MO328_00200 [Xanthomonas translucens]
MKIKDALENYYVYSGKASDIVRQLALGGIAIIWVFQVAEGKSHTLPSELFFPLKLIVAALAADLLQYAIGGLIWSAYHRYKEGHLTTDEFFKAPTVINWPSLGFYYAKVVLVITAYWYLWQFLSQVLRQR